MDFGISWNISRREGIGVRRLQHSSRGQGFMGMMHASASMCASGANCCIRGTSDKSFLVARHFGALRDGIA